MRRSEIYNIQAEHFNPDLSLLYIPFTKTGKPRTIPLSSRAVKAITDFIDIRLNYPNYKASSASQTFLRACRRVQIKDLHFHDLRHEATSRFFEKAPQYYGSFVNYWASIIKYA